MSPGRCSRSVQIAFARGLRAQQRLHVLQMAVQLRLLFLRQRSEQRTDFVARPCIERPEHRLALRGEVQMRLACVVAGALALQPAAARELREDAAQVAGVERQVADQVARERPLPMRDLVQHAHLRQRAVAVEQAAAQHADLLRVEAVELAHGIDVRIGGAGTGHGDSLAGRSPALSVN